jgi:chromate transporter
LLRGIRGALATVSGQALPSFLMILILAYVYITYSDIPIMRSILKGVGAVVVGLVVSVVFRMGKTSLKDYKSLSFAIVTFICHAVFKLNPIAFTKLDPTFVILGAGLLGALLY